MPQICIDGGALKPCVVADPDRGRGFPGVFVRRLGARPRGEGPCSGPGSFFLGAILPQQATSQTYLQHTQERCSASLGFGQARTRALHAQQRQAAQAVSAAAQQAPCNKRH